MDADWFPLVAQMQLQSSHLTASTPSPAAVNDTDALSVFLSEVQQLEAMELFQFEDEDAAKETDACTSCYYSIQEGESAVKKRYVELKSPAWSLQVKPNALRKKKLTSTQRRRLEIDKLRVTAQQLQQKLGQLESKKTEEQTRRIDDEASPMDVDHGDEMWAHTAIEVENVYLQEQIAGLQMLIDNVTSLLQQSTVYLQNWTSMDAQSKLHIDSMRDEFVFRMLEQKLWLNGHEVKLQLESGIPAAVNELTDATFRQKGSVMEWQSSRLLPFSVAAARTAVWQCRKARFSATKLDLVLLDDATNSLAFKQEVVLYPTNQPEITLQIRGVCRRFSSKHRIVHVWEGACDWSTALNAPCTATVESGWMSLQSVGEAEAPLSVMHSFAQMRPSEITSDWVQQAVRLGVLERDVRLAFGQILQDRHQCIENWLMDAAGNSHCPLT